MCKDVVHHILALSIVVQKDGGQPIHLTVMLSEQLFEFLLICHTLLIHTKTDLLNPLIANFYVKFLPRQAVEPSNRKSHVVFLLVR